MGEEALISVTSFLYPRESSLGLPCWCCLGYTHCFSNGRGGSPVGMGNCTGAPILPQVTLKWTLELYHQNTHRSPAWDESDGPSLKFSIPATWTGLKDCWVFIESSEKIFSLC